MNESISFSGAGFTLSEKAISTIITTVFPGDNYLIIISLFLAWFLIGFSVFQIFFYFSKKKNMLKTMSKIQLIIFSIFFGFFSFMVTIITYLPLVFLGYDPLQFVTGNMFSFIILSGFLLYGCLSFSSMKINGRDFLKRAFTYLVDFFMLFAMNFMWIVFFFDTMDFKMLSWIIIDIIYVKFTFIPRWKNKK